MGKLFEDGNNYPVPFNGTYLILERNCGAGIGGGTGPCGRCCASNMPSAVLPRVGQNRQPGRPLADVLLTDVLLVGLPEAAKGPAVASAALPSLPAASGWVRQPPAAPVREPFPAWGILGGCISGLE